MGMYFGSAKERLAYEEERRLREDQAVAELDDARRKFAAKIVMAVVDKIVTDIVRPGPVPEERECYEMAGEVRALVPDLEALVAKIIKNEGDK